jgi:hypothetical protein
MSELINVPSANRILRRQLFAAASALALIAAVSATRKAEAAERDTDSPTVWIELGGQFEHLSGGSETFSPAFFSLASPANLAPMVDAQRKSAFSLGEEGKISVTPSETDWTFSAAIRYGRSHAARHQHHHTPAGGLGPIYVGNFYVTKNFVPGNLAYGDGQTSLSESHLILDFEAGKDVGLGLFGVHGSSVISAGVRFAQFTSSSNISLHARPIYQFGFVTSPGVYRLFEPFHANYTAVMHAQRSTRAVGPSVSWNAFAPLVGNSADLTLNVDWGLNAAALFGRQRAHIHHQTTGYHYHKYGGLYGTKNIGGYAHMPPDQNRSRSVIIPNIGGFAGLSLKFPNAEVSLGYRADFYFGAVDGGIDIRKAENIGYYGPFATISIGLGG